MTDIKQHLSKYQLTDLRNQNLITKEEIAWIAGDLVIAENPVTSERRVIGEIFDVLAESNKRLLKG